MKPLLPTFFCLCLFSTGFAETSTSPVFGIYQFDVPQGKSVWVSGLVTKSDFGGKMDGFTPGAQSVISQTGASFENFSNHYVEIKTGPWEGLPLDILSNMGETITVEGDLGPSGFQLSGDEAYFIRSHVTLIRLLPSSCGLVQGVDSVTVYDASGSPQSYTFDGNNWIDGEGNNANNVKIRPGQGFQITAAQARTLTIGNSEVTIVKNSPTWVLLRPGSLNLIGAVNPLVATDTADPLFPSELPLGSDDLDTSEVEQGLGLKDSFDSFTDSVRIISRDGAFSGTTFLFSGTNLIDALATDADGEKVPVGSAVAVTVGTQKYVRIPSFLEISQP